MPVTPSSVELYDFRLEIPKTVPQPPKRSQQLTREIRRQSGWSQRQLAVVLGITHPTVRALEEGRSRPGDAKLIEKLTEVDAVVSRVFAIAGQDASETTRILCSKASEGNQSAVELLEIGRPAEAYLAAMDVANLSRRAGLMNGLWSARAGEGTHDISTAELT